MSKTQETKKTTINTSRYKNGNFMGLAFSYEQASTILFGIPWDVTVSTQAGTGGAPKNILKSSHAVNLFDPAAPELWQKGIFMLPLRKDISKKNKELRAKVEEYLDHLEEGGNINDNPKYSQIVARINEECAILNEWVYQETSQMLDDGKTIGLIGGEHSVALGYLQALAERFPAFGVLHIDAHAGLTEAYQGFEFSHQSVIQHIKNIKQVKKIVQVGTRDLSDNEYEIIKKSRGKIKPFLDHDVRQRIYDGESWKKICAEIINALPQNIYISIDMDGLNPSLCPNASSPVAGGMEFNELTYLIESIVASGKQIIGFDVAEAGGNGHDWDGNVAARLIYKIVNQVQKSYI